MAADRRERFREYIRNLNPTADPLQTLDQGMYVAHPLATSSRIAHRLDIEPASSHLLVGGTGSGKTTELRRARAILESNSDVVTFFWDVPVAQKVSALREGVLVALAFKGIANALQEIRKLKKEPFNETINIAIQNGNQLANGYWEEPDGPHPDDDLVHIPGILTPPEIDRKLEGLTEMLQAIVDNSERHFAIFFDGLDRVRQSSEFAKMVLQDVATLSRIGIGAVIVGPQEIRFELHRHITERFTAFYLHGAADIADKDSIAFIDTILSRRDPKKLLSVEARERLIMWSGGVLRDLISLARDAGEVAYSSGDELISEKHIDIAADRFGRTLLLGIKPAMAKQLLNLRNILKPRAFALKSSVDFVAATDLDISLLLHRLVIEIPDTPVRYIVHPCIQPHMDALRASVR